MCLFWNPGCLLSNETSFTQKFNLAQKRWVKDHKHLILSISKLFCLWANSKPDSTHFWNQINYTNKVCFGNIFAWIVYNELLWCMGMERSWVVLNRFFSFSFFRRKKNLLSWNQIYIPAYFNSVNLLITMAHLEIKVLKFSSIQETCKKYPFNWKRKKKIYFFLNFLDFYFYIFNFRISKITKRSHFGELKGNLPNRVDRRTILNTN